MDTDKWTDERHLLFDEHVLIFTTKEQKKKIYQVRIRVSKKTGYVIRKSLKTGDLNEAIHLATQLYYEARARASQGIPIRKYSWDDLVTRYFETLSNGCYRTQFTESNNRYFREFFSKYKDMIEVDDEEIKAFWVYRVNYWKNHKKMYTPKPSRMRATNVSEQPSYATIYKIRSQLRSIFLYAFKRSIIPVLPDIQHPYKGNRKLDTLHLIHTKKRASITLEEYSNQLLPKLNGLCKRKEAHLVNKPNIHRTRQALKLAIITIANTALRPSELYSLTYRQVRTVRDDDTVWTEIHLPAAQAKMNKQRIIPSDAGESTYQMINHYRENYAKWTDDDHLIFARDSDPYKPRDMITTFNKYMVLWDLKYDAAGMARTLYSFRHFRIEQWLIRGVPPAAIAAVAGTSLKMISSFYDGTDAWLYRKLIVKGRKHYPLSQYPKNNVIDLDTARTPEKTS